jgi:hypothetical protein
LTTVACDLAHPNPAVAPSSDPAIAGGSTEAQRRGVAEATARRDFACDNPKVVADLLASESTGSSWEPKTSGRPRYLVEGCGKRGMYVESCRRVDDSFHADSSPLDHASAPVFYECRYLLASMVPVRAPEAAKPSGGSATATADGVPAPNGGGVTVTVTTVSGMVPEDEDEDDADAGAGPSASASDAAAGL